MHCGLKETPNHLHSFETALVDIFTLPYHVSLPLPVGRGGVLNINSLGFFFLLSMLKVGLSLMGDIADIAV